MCDLCDITGEYSVRFPYDNRSEGSTVGFGAKKCRDGKSVGDTVDDLEVTDSSVGHSV